MPHCICFIACLPFEFKFQIQIQIHLNAFLFLPLSLFWPSPSSFSLSPFPPARPSLAGLFLFSPQRGPAQLPSSSFPSSSVRPSFSFPRPSPPARQFPSFSSLAHADRRTPPVGVIPDLEPDLGSSPCPAAAPHVCPHRVSPKPARQGP
jgi:hypothetical protein